MNLHGYLLMNDRITILAIVAGFFFCNTVPVASASGPPLQDTPSVEHRAAVALARRGQYEPALQRLSALVAAYPSQRRFRHDYISVLAWAGRDVEVLAQLPGINLKQAPGYVLMAIGKSARNRQQPELAIEVYRIALKRGKEKRQARLGLALSLAEAGYAADAEDQMKVLLKSEPGSIELLEAFAYVKEMDRDFAGAIGLYDRVLRRDPAHRAARRGRILNLMRLGATDEAVRLLQRESGLFTAKEREMIAGNYAATVVRWGRLPTVNPADRHQDTDKAIALLRSRYQQMKDKTGVAALRNRFELVNAYRNRRFMREAVMLYEQLTGDGVKQFPPYVLAAAGEAYLSLRQPEQAVLLLEKAVKGYPGDLDAQYALYYAYLESGQYERSLAHIDQLAASLPDRTWRPGGNDWDWSADKLYARTVAAQARAYVGKLENAERELRSLLMQAPADPDVRNAFAGVALWRGWPRQALSEYRIVLARDPENPGARTGVGRVAYTRGEVVETDAILDSLLLHHRDDPHVQELARDVGVRDMREVWLGVNAGRSSSALYQGSSELAVEGYYYDKPYQPGLRPFLFLSHSEADFFGQTASRNRIAAGLDYRGRDVVLRGSISDGDGSAALSFFGDWSFSDHWKGRLALDSFSLETPLQAELSGVEAWSFEMGTEYRFHESRSVGLSARRMGFDDGNRRNILTAFGRQRLFTGLRYQLDGELTAYRQTNSKRGAAYFNPAGQTSMELALNNQWQTWRRYEKSLHQRLLVGVGATAQQGFDTRPTWRVGYEHHWSFSRRLGLSYGISRTRPVYDGEQQYTTRGFINVYARF